MNNEFCKNATVLNELKNSDGAIEQLKIIKIILKQS